MWIKKSWFFILFYLFFRWGFLKIFVSKQTTAAQVLNEKISSCVSDVCIVFIFDKLEIVKWLRRQAE